MMKGLLLAYAVIFCAYFPVGIAGYAAFGNTVDADVLLTVANPQWLIRVANIMVVVHVGASWQVSTTLNISQRQECFVDLVILCTQCQAASPSEHTYCPVQRCRVCRY